MRSEITRAIDLVERAKNDLKDNVEGDADTCPAIRYFPGNARVYCKGRTCGSRKRTSPYSVTPRIVRSADVASAVL